MERRSYPNFSRSPGPAYGAPDGRDARHTRRTTDVSAHPWDGYLTGPENELALAAAQALARGERDGISPLVIYGPSGSGKSRLLAGLVTEFQRRYVLIRQSYISMPRRLLPHATMRPPCQTALVGPYFVVDFVPLSC